MLTVDRRLGFLLACLLFLLSGEPAYAQPAARSGGSVMSAMPQFPTVRASNLEGKDFTLPKDFEGELNLLLIAFERRQQEDVDTWMPLARHLCLADSNLRAYELPTIRRGNPIMRWMINRGMASGIHDARARASTITLYLDKSEFRRSLAIEREDEITVLLVKRDGSIHWRTTGTWSPAMEESLRQVVREKSGGPRGTQ